LFCIATANGAINLNSATIKWKDRITKCFIEKKQKGKKKKREESNGIKNMIALAWIEWPDSDYRRPLMT
jgi:hypothetical protein